MIPFRVTFRPGVSLFDQIVYASKKAMISGDLRPGDPFPSVRALSKELKINPNTAHKVISHLVTTGLLETRPGLGTIVANLPEAPSSERTQLLTDEIEQLVVEAKRLRINFEDVTASISEHWKRLGGKPKSPPESNRGSRSQR